MRCVGVEHRVKSLLSKEMTTILRVAGFIFLVLAFKQFFPDVFDGMEKAMLGLLGPDFLQASPIPSIAR
ncbi:MAG: hypothetical protein U1D31_03585 [Patescibacteria group bacterium]|nr:hypothetical protein [bacterium]MDZ4241174.1 hypothetical protein [Patescibacteria group bacterium]